MGPDLVRRNDVVDVEHILEDIEVYDAEEIAGNDVNCEVENQEMADVDENCDVGPVGNSSIPTEQKQSEIAENDASCVIENQEMVDGDEYHDVEYLEQQNSAEDSAGNNNLPNNDKEIEIQSGDHTDGPVGNSSIPTEQKFSFASHVVDAMELHQAMENPAKNARMFTSTFNSQNTSEDVLSIGLTNVSMSVLYDVSSGVQDQKLK